ncbi:hypothetical protein KFE25_005334 [Diacronema lutheri]|uniref:Uncharacterized protein n=1 Tax=Diacronema lutheri TaxID=2081491 RepID=A0A8J5XM18_DIALT|nr:hypothetical protein KFE25_005334 [Diacronema lutheri]
MTSSSRSSSISTHVPWARVRELPTWCERYGLAEQLAAVSALSTAELVRLIFTFSMNGREVRFVERPDGRRFVQTDWTSQLPWRLNADGTLQVDHYPRHTVSRLSNWGWRTANAYVALDSRPEAADGALQDELDKACGLLRPSACGA